MPDLPPIASRPCSLVAALAACTALLGAGPAAAVDDQGTYLLDLAGSDASGAHRTTTAKLTVR